VVCSHNWSNSGKKLANVGEEWCFINPTNKIRESNENKRKKSCEKEEI
jgi:hypothetical protein